MSELNVESNEPMIESNDQLIEDLNQNNSDLSEENVDKSGHKSGKKVKKVLNTSDQKSDKRGIIYISYIPPGLNVNKIRQLMSEFGEVDRIYLEKQKSLNASNDKKRSTKKSYNCKYIEGWVEFKRKRISKMVANLLNGKQIGGKRKTRYYDQIWSLKYLHKFKWSHLAEQLTYENALRQQKLRFEITRAKKETNFYQQMSHKLKHNKNVDKNGNQLNDNRKYKQRITDEVIRKSKTSDNDIDFELLSKIFK